MYTTQQPAPVPESTAAPPVPLATEPAHLGHHSVPQASTREIRTYLLVWTWQGDDLTISSARLRLSPDEAADLHRRFTHFRRTEEICTFALEEEPSETMSYPEFLQDAPALLVTEDTDAPIRPKHF